MNYTDTEVNDFSQIPSRNSNAYPCISGINSSKQFLEKDDFWSANNYPPEVFQDMGVSDVSFGFESIPLIPDKFQINQTQIPVRESTANELNTHKPDNDIGTYTEQRNALLGNKDTQEFAPLPNNESLRNPQNDMRLRKYEEDKETEGKNTTSSVNKRWGKKQDNKLFKVLREMEACHKICFNDVIWDEEGLKNLNRKLLRDLCREVKWISNPKKLLKRIKNFWDKDFSVRELKALKRIMRKDFDYKNVDLEQISKHFPSKSMENIMNMVEMLTEKYELKTLSLY
ncbi:unnamed protein product [Moneuplotes crassus]|uniref:Uncharacterized protein n=1 Tax=Euplotes crassus TaxID=5936 RepID=A0AAD2D6D9_EUPCR|nr:unnamed protein product [Moneuplotes crassus]